MHAGYIDNIIMISTTSMRHLILSAYSQGPSPEPPQFLPKDNNYGGFGNTKVFHLMFFFDNDRVILSSYGTGVLLRERRRTVQY